jgi:hypothetical protein
MPMTNNKTMDIFRGLVVRCLAVAAMAVMLCVVPTRAVHAAETGQYASPDLTGFALHHEDDGDGDGDGLKETHIIHYVNQAGDRIFSMTSNGRLWAWSLSSQQNQADPAGNYVIRDSNCDGVFDERSTLDEEFHVPDCLK